MKKTICPKCLGTGKVDDLFSIGADLRRLREGAGLSLREMAARLNMSPAYLSDLERGHRAWRPDLIKRYEDALS